MWWASGPTIQFLFFCAAIIAKRGALRPPLGACLVGIGAILLRCYGHLGEMLRQFCAEVGEKALTFTLRSFTIPRL